MKLSVLMPIYNRADLLTIGLASLAAQGMTDWELVLIDDQSTQDLSEVYSTFPINVQHIRLDPRGHPDYRGYHTPALALNVGIRHARGDVICITQPEIIHSSESLQRGYDQALQDEFVFGKVMLTTGAFTKWVKKNWSTMPFDGCWNMGLELAGTPFQDHELYWYIGFVKKKHAEAINGVNESYLQGVYGEDDEVKERLRSHGVLPALNKGIRGIHIDHSHEGDLYPKQDRRANFWERGAEINRTRFAEFLAGPREAVIDQPNWGADTYIEWTKEQKYG